MLSVNRVEYVEADVSGANPRTEARWITKERKMKAIVRDNYGSPDVLELREIEKPTPREDEVLVKVHAASVNAMDYRFLTGTPYLARIMAGLLKPRQGILGLDVAGRVEEVGAIVDLTGVGVESRIPVPIVVQISTWITCVALPIEVAVFLFGVADIWAVITHVTNSIYVSVLLIGVRCRRAVVTDITAKVGINV